MQQPAIDPQAVGGSREQLPGDERAGTSERDPGNKDWQRLRPSTAGQLVIVEHGGGDPSRLMIYVVAPDMAGPPRAIRVPVLVASRAHGILFHYKKGSLPTTDRAARSDAVGGESAGGRG